MEPIEVTARFDAQGKTTPLSFVWQGKTYTVESSGRRWEDERGQHILIMIPDGQVFELLFAAAEGRWYLKLTKTRRTMA